MKRVFDIAASFLGLVVLLPLFLGVAVAVKLSGGGPVFFRQERVGRGGRLFRLAKFRTMVVDAPRLGMQLTVAGDPRITPVGAFLRRTKIDELPQLWNVLVGDMSLVGPRPEVPRYVALYDAEQRRVLDVRPGITDYASIVYFDENSVLARSPDPERTYVEEVMPHKLSLNLRYIARHGLVEDLRIILATVYLALQDVIGRAGKTGQVLLDMGVVAASLWLAYLLRFEGQIPEQSWKQLVVLLPYAMVARVGCNFLFGVYRILWRYVSLYEVPRFLKSIGAVSVVFLGFRLALPGHAYYSVPFSIIALEGLLSFLGMLGLRFLRRWLHETTANTGATAVDGTEKVVVIGAGDNGHNLAKEIRLRSALNLTLVGFIDDDPGKQGIEIEGARVLGPIEALPELYRRYRFSQALLAITDLPFPAKRKIVETCDDLGVKVRVLPGTSELISGKAEVAAVRDVAIEDLLGRPVADLTRDDPLLQPVYGGKRILITGAGGSIGSEMCRQIANLGPSRLTLVEKDENNLFTIRGELARRWPSLDVDARIVDVRHRDRLRAAFLAARPHVVIHAAAYKHVPLMEENPGEAVENNVVGTRNLAELAVEHGVETFVMLSTDKAVNPTSVMGATKRIAELIVRGLAERCPDTRFASVRFGNVLGSRGSVIPTFREQIARGGPVTVTHPEVTRYFMTIPEASQLVLKAGTLGHKGEVFVLDMGTPIRIVDLARDMIRLSGFKRDEIPIEITGLRPGEKLFEELLLDRDRVLATPVEKVFVSKPELRDFRAFEAQIEGLAAAARTEDLAGIRAMLAAMDIGLRPPDTGDGRLAMASDCPDDGVPGPQTADRGLQT